MVADYVGLNRTDWRGKVAMGHKGTTFEDGKLNVLDGQEVKVGT